MKCIAATLALLSAPALAQDAPPPVAEKKPFLVTSPNGAREDDYYWLRDDTRKNPEMLAYLAAENAYADRQLAPTKALQETIFSEVVGRIKQDDSSVPFRKNGYLYYTRYETGADYPLIARRKGDMAAPEEIVFDQPRMAAGSGYFQIGDRAVSPDNRMIAYAEDRVGRRQFVFKVKDLTTGAVLADTISDIAPNLVWADDNMTVFYVEKDPTTLAVRRVKAHVLGTPVATDRLVYEEEDDAFTFGIVRTSDGKFLCIAEHSTVSDETRCAPASDPTTFTVLAPRQRDLLYDADHAGGRWVIRTNLDAPNYRLATASDADAAKGTSAWADLVPGRADAFIEGFKPFDSFVAVEERSGGVKRLRIVPTRGAPRDVQSDEPAYAMALSINEEANTSWLRYTYDSLTTPQTTFEVNAESGERRVLKVQPVPGYDPAKYVTERVWSVARDGTRIPVSLVYRKGLKKGGKAGLLQYGYGSYGVSIDPAFNPLVPSLLDRGMVYAVAHVRGGQEMGRRWYDDGHLLHKKNSFTDFIDVTRDLVARGYAAKDRVAAQGASAGGLLMGGIANMAPDDYRVIVAQVPFVDVVTTMLDTSIPLTTNEYEEWGNPARKLFYDYMLSYSPYDHVAAKAYPAMFVSTGLFDSQVQYYEPAKWVARLRATATPKYPLVFRVNMQAGHGGKSGRFQRYHDSAEAMAFALTQLGVDR